MRVLLAGWFSYEKAHATAGDLLVAEVVRDWLLAAGHSCDVARADPFQGGVDLDRADPRDYSHVMFVCGPFMQREWEGRFLGRFADCRVIGVNLTLPVPVEAWNPFDFLLERDSSRAVRPDLSFVSVPKPVPVAGICLVERHEGGLVDLAKAAIDRLVAAREMATVPIDTRLDLNSTGLRTAAEVESLLSRMDLVITTRLHGTVLALKHGIPALAIDTVPGGGKVQRQAESIGWPAVVRADALDDERLHEAFEYCLSDAARARAKDCAARAVAQLREVERMFVPTLEALATSPAKRSERRAFAISQGWQP
jgi:hypothetical protein